MLKKINSSWTIDPDILYKPAGSKKPSLKIGLCLWQLTHAEKLITEYESMVNKKCSLLTHTTVRHGYDRR